MELKSRRVGWGHLHRAGDEVMFVVLFIEVAAEGVLVRVVHLVVTPRPIDGRDNLACLCNTQLFSAC